MRARFVCILAITIAACGPAPRNNGDDTTPGDDAPDAGPCVAGGTEATPDTCNDQVDEDCDGLADCHDPDCSGVGICPVCGEVATDEGAGITLPDGIVGTTCTTDAECGGGTPECVESECHASYVSTLNVIGFGQNQTFDDPNLIESVCATMEHTWLRDMEIRLIAPNGQIVRLQKFLGRTGGEVYLGEANDCDEGAPSPGTGELYCWKPTATNPPMLDYANAGVGMGSAANCFASTSLQLPPGDYSAADPWANLIGTSLNGQWKFVVTDLWPIDNGFLFDWTIKFNADVIPDCGGPIIE